MKLNMRSGVWNNLTESMLNIVLLTPLPNLILNFDSEYSLCFLTSVTIGQDLEFSLLALVVKDKCHHWFGHLHVHNFCHCGLLHAVVSWQGHNLVSNVAGFLNV